MTINLDESVWPPAVTAVSDHYFTWCETCGNQVIDEKCYCWLSVAETLERYLAFDHDHAADWAMHMWHALSDGERERIWTAEYADSHDVPTYPCPDSELADGVPVESVS